MAKTQSGHHAAYEKLTQLLASHTLKPGQIISQKELVELMGMGLSAVRLALARLETEGMCTILPQHGIKFVEPSLDLFKNLLQIRITIEKEAWSQFAVTAPEETLDELIAVHAGFLRECEGPMTDELLDRISRYDKQMHTRVVEAMGNERLTEMFRVLNLTINFLRADRGWLRPNNVRNSMSVHLEMLEAAKKRETWQLVDIVERHILNATRVLLAV